MKDEVLATELETYNSMRVELESEHAGEWVVIHGSEVSGFYEKFDQAAQEALGRFGLGPYLIREVGAPEGIELPVSLVYDPP